MMEVVDGSKMNSSHTSRRSIQENDICITTTDEELKYRRQLFPEPSSVLKANVRCTACGATLLKQLNKGRDLCFHPILQVLVCEDCRAFYGDGIFPVDDDNSDTYCRWCAQGGNLFCCSSCNYVFCKPCVRRNFKKSMLEEIEEEDWKCFVCNSESLWKHRAICSVARMYVRENPGHDDEEIESSNDERLREKRRVAREKKWRKKGKKSVENHESPKKSKTVACSSRTTRKEESSDESDDEYGISKKHRREKADQHKKKETEKHRGNKSNKRKEEESEEAVNGEDDDNDLKGHKHRKLKERDKHQKEKGAKRHAPSPPQTNTLDGNDNSDVVASCSKVLQRSIDEEAQQISVMRKTCVSMKKLTRDTLTFTHMFSKKTATLHNWISEKNKVSHKQLPTSPAKLTKLINCFKKILLQLGAHSEEMQRQVLEAEKDWKNIVEGNREGETEVSVDGEQYQEKNVSNLGSEENAGASLDLADNTQLVGGNDSTPDVAEGEAGKTIDSEAEDESDNTIAGNVKTLLNPSLDQFMSDEGEKDNESAGIENGEEMVENGSVSDTEKSLTSKDALGTTKKEEGDDKSVNHIEEESGEMRKSPCQEKEASPEPESHPCNIDESLCSEGKDKIESQSEKDICEDRGERISMEGGEKSDVDGSLEGERTSEAIGESGKSSKIGSEKDMAKCNLLLQGLSEGNTEKSEQDSKNVKEGAENVPQLDKSIQDLFESDKEDNDVNVNTVISLLDNEFNSTEGGIEMEKDTVVDEEISKRTSIDNLKEKSVGDVESENNIGDCESTSIKIKPSLNDRNAKMAFLLDTSSSDSEKSVKNKKHGRNKLKINSNSSESDNEKIESDNSSAEEKVKKSKKLLVKSSISSLLSQYEDNKLKAGCFVPLERIKNHNHKIVDFGIKGNKRDSMMKAINRLGNLANLERTNKNNSDGTESVNDSDEHPIKKKKRIVKKKSEPKENEEEAQRDSSDDDDHLLVSDPENIDGPSKIDIKSEDKMMDALAAELLANSSPNDSSSSDSDYNPTKKKTDNESKNKTNKEKKEIKVKKESDDDSGDESSSDLEVVRPKASWRRDKLLRGKLSATDSSEEEKKWKAKKEKEKALSSDSEDGSDSNALKARKKSLRRLAGSDSDVLGVSSSVKNTDSSDFENKEKKRKRVANSSSNSDKSSGSKVRKKKKLRRIKMLDSDSDNKENKKKENKDKDKDKDEDEDEEQSPKGRKNIRKVMKGNRLTEETKAAAKDEEERLKRIAERQKVYNEIFTDQQKLETLDKIVLDFDPDTKKGLVSVHPTLVKKMKPHQAEGVKFMWEACFESLKRIEESKGSGCILAHCMGLGKTLQVIALVHTLLTNRKTNINTVLVICPLNTVLNWVNEFQIWTKDIGSGSDVEVYELSRYKANVERMHQLKDWQNDGGVMILGYEMYRNLSSGTGKRIRKKFQDVFRSTLVDPGPDLVICDEGHLLKNIQSALSKAVNSIRTARRIVLTGTPLQNNLKEYHCMIQFVKPSLLGTTKEFLNRFVNPITNGQLADSTPHDVRVMKRRAHVLHKMLEGSVQRRDYLVLTPFLPPKYEFVIGIQLTELQSKLYVHYIENFARVGGGTSLFNDFQNLQRIWTHPRLLKIKADNEEKKRLMESDSEGSLKDFIDDDETTTTSSSESSNSRQRNKKRGKMKGSSSSVASVESDIIVINDENKEEKSKESKGDDKNETEEGPLSPKEWWENYIVPEDYEKLEHSGKLVLLFDILQKCELIGDKVLVFSQSLDSLDVIEHFLENIDDYTQKIGSQAVEDSLGEESDSTPKFIGSWSKGLDYFRIDGSVSAENRSLWCKQFNKEENLRARLFLISTRAGGIGINLVGANRVILFDASWNPSNDLQSIFRIYRFGQNKPCYIYRFLGQSTMEEKIYNRQITKLSLALRVVDEQQIERHFNLDDLQELYRYEPKVKTKRPTPMLPKDRLLAELIQKYPDLIENYHEHDSLLVNQTAEELNEEERKAAWEDFENDKKGVLPDNNFQAPGVAAFGGMVAQMMYRNDVYGGNEAALREAILARQPNATEEEIATELNVAASRIRQYFANSAYPQMQQMQFYNATAQQMHNRPPMNIFPGQNQRFPQQMALLNQYGLQNYYHNPVIPSSSTNHNQMMAHMIGSTPFQHMMQNVNITPIHPQSTQASIQPQGNRTARMIAPKLKVRNDLMPASIHSRDDDIIIE